MADSKPFELWGAVGVHELPRLLGTVQGTPKTAESRAKKLLDEREDVVYIDIERPGSKRKRVERKQPALFTGNEDS